jgi:hypothetical protein
LDQTELFHQLIILVVHWRSRRHQVLWVEAVRGDRYPLSGQQEITMAVVVAVVEVVIILVVVQVLQVL